MCVNVFWVCVSGRGGCGGTGVRGCGVWAEVGRTLTCGWYYVRCCQISIITEIAQNALLLSKHPYGNYVVQHLLGKKHRGLRVSTFPGMLEAVTVRNGKGRSLIVCQA